MNEKEDFEKKKSKKAGGTADQRGKQEVLS